MMNLRETLKRILGERAAPAADEQPLPEFVPDFDSSAANFRIGAQWWGELSTGGGSGRALQQYTVLGLLEEQGDAIRLPNGFRMESRNVSRLDAEISDLLGLPGPVPGILRTEVTSNTTSSHFRITPYFEVEGIRVPVERHGAVITIGTGEHVLTPTELDVVEAIEHHSGLPPAERTEAANVSLAARLHEARHESLNDSRGRPLDIDLGHLEKFATTAPNKVEVTVTQHSDGSLELSPNLGEGTEDINILDYEQQLERSDVLRIDDRLILLHEQQKAGVREISRNRRIPATQRDAFLAAPGEFLDPSLVDLDITFGVRVEGIGAIVPLTFTEAEESGIDWLTAASEILAPEALEGLIDSVEELEDVKEKIQSARHLEQPTITHDEKIVDISDPEATDEAISKTARKVAARTDETELPEATNETVQVGMYISDSRDRSDQLRELAENAAKNHEPDLSRLRFTPFPHQRDGIAWAAGMMAASLSAQDAQTRVQGGLLADDMGLGKTFMTLVSLRDFMSEQQRRSGHAKPILAVLPLSLIENWEDELRNAFEENPFNDVVVLQSSRDQDRFRIQGRGTESRASTTLLDDHGMVDESTLRLSLRVGETQKDRRLDMPGRLVLTTYQNLGRYQLSLGLVEWGAVIFDEAQQIKNPETLASRAAKGLKADFKLLCTGTPVENSLRDIWNLLDTAQPDLLGDWRTFRERWITSDENATAEDQATRGKELRNVIGRFMLRRTKEDNIDALPSKTIYTGLDSSSSASALGQGYEYDVRLSNEMPSAQRAAYDRILQMHRPRKGGALETIQRLKNVSLHPATLSESGAAWDPDLSARVHGMVQVLDDIRDADEKAIIFVISKTVQARLAVWLHERYGFTPKIVNGETKAVESSSSKTRGTRKSIINDFESRPGFNLIIMSPLAVGVGLTVVGANHAIHLERHWNPAKEAQATDRIYRIGQTKPVHVYLPLANHPTLESFDVNLDNLLRSKTDLKDSVVIPGKVEDEMMRKMGLSDSEATP